MKDKRLRKAAVHPPLPLSGGETPGTSVPQKDKDSQLASDVSASSTGTSQSQLERAKLALEVERLAFDLRNSPTKGERATRRVVEVVVPIVTATIALAAAL